MLSLITNLDPLCLVSMYISHSHTLLSQTHTNTQALSLRSSKQVGMAEQYVPPKTHFKIFYFTNKFFFVLSENCASFFGYLATTHTKEHLALLGSSFLARKAWTDPQIAAEAGI